MYLLKWSKSHPWLGLCTAHAAQVLTSLSAQVQGALCSLYVTCPSSVSRGCKTLLYLLSRTSRRSVQCKSNYSSIGLDGSGRLSPSIRYVVEAVRSKARRTVGRIVLDRPCNLSVTSFTGTNIRGFTRVRIQLLVCRSPFQRQLSLQMIYKRLRAHYFGPAFSKVSGHWFIRQVLFSLCGTCASNKWSYAYL